MYESLEQAIVYYRKAKEKEKDEEKRIEYSWLEHWLEELQQYREGKVI